MIPFSEQVGNCDISEPRHESLWSGLANAPRIFTMADRGSRVRGRQPGEQTLSPPFKMPSLTFSQEEPLFKSVCIGGKRSAIRKPPAHSVSIAPRRFVTRSRRMRKYTARLCNGLYTRYRVDVLPPLRRKSIPRTDSLTCERCTRVSSGLDRTVIGGVDEPCAGGRQQASHPRGRRCLDVATRCRLAASFPTAASRARSPGMARSSAALISRLSLFIARCLPSATRDRDRSFDPSHRRRACLAIQSLKRRSGQPNREQADRAIFSLSTTIRWCAWPSRPFCSETTFG